MKFEDAKDVTSTYLIRLRIPKDLWDAYPFTFSSGERQRVNIARILIMKNNQMVGSVTPGDIPVSGTD